MSEATFIFQVDEDLKEQFTKAAEDQACTGAQLLRDFMREFVQQQRQAPDGDTWFRRQVQIGLDSANAGNLIPADEVEAKFAAKREASSPSGQARARHRHPGTGGAPALYPRLRHRR